MLQGDEGAAAVVGSMASNTALLELGLDDNKITDAAPFVLPLSNNHTLTTLRLQNNKLSAASKKALKPLAAGSLKLSL